MINVKNGPKRPYGRPKRAKKCMKKGKQKEFSDLKNLLFSGISLAELGGIEVRMNCSD